MFYDPESEKVLLIGGYQTFGGFPDLHDIWTYDTSKRLWEEIGEVDPQDAPLTLGLDEESGVVIALNLFPYNTWAYDISGGTWEQLQHPDQPTKISLIDRYGSPMAYDSESDRLILFSGGEPGHLFTDTWAYDYNTDTWEEMHPKKTPKPRAMHHIAYDIDSDRVILWGGYFGESSANTVPDLQVWAYDYNTDTWESFENVNGPQKHWERGGMVFIPEQDRFLLFTGLIWDDRVVEPETWFYEYDTNTWTRVETQTSPPGLAMYTMAYDPTVGKVILFGGEGTSKHGGDIKYDVWLFDVEKENWSKLEGPENIDPYRAQ